MLKFMPLWVLAAGFYIKIKKYNFPPAQKSKTKHTFSGKHSMFFPFLILPLNFSLLSAALPYSHRTSASLQLYELSQTTEVALKWSTFFNPSSTS